MLVNLKKTVLLLTFAYFSVSCKSNTNPNPNKPKNNSPKGHSTTSATSLLAITLDHQDKRFKTLRTILNKGSNYHLIFPGKNAQQHALGTGIAKKAWSNLQEHSFMVNSIIKKLEDLENDFPGRIHYSWIGDYRFNSKTGNCDRTKVNKNKLPGANTDGNFYIHVWGANAENFNYPNGKNGSFGNGQASCFSHQRPGVFGISTMPSTSRKVLLADDLCLSLYP